MGCRRLDRKKGLFSIIVLGCPETGVYDGTVDGILGREIEYPETLSPKGGLKVGSNRAAVIYCF